MYGENQLINCNLKYFNAVISLFIRFYTYTVGNSIIDKLGTSSKIYSAKLDDTLLQLVILYTC